MVTPSYTEWADSQGPALRLLDKLGLTVLLPDEVLSAMSEAEDHQPLTVTVMPVTQDQIDRAVAVARRYGATRVLLFGSALDDPETARDLDLAVEGVEGWEFFGMSAEMERDAGVALDVIPLDKDNWFTRRIRERGRPLYEHT